MVLERRFRRISVADSRIRWVVITKRVGADSITVVAKTRLIHLLKVGYIIHGPGRRRAGRGKRAANHDYAGASAFDSKVG